MRRLVRTLEALSEACGYVAGTVVLGLTVFIASAVFARRVLGTPILATDEVSGYLLLTIVFLGIAYTMKAGGHIRADILLSHVSAQLRGSLELLAVILALVFAAALLAGNWALAAEYYTRGTLSFRYLQTPLWLPASLLVVGSAILLLQLVAQLLAQILRDPDPRP